MRRVELEGLTNFRDMGGYVGHEGRTVASGKLFRSDTLARLTDADIATLYELGVRIACDFRYGDERLREPSRLLGDARFEVLTVGLDERPTASFLDSFDPVTHDADGARDYLMSNYAEYPELYADAYRQVLARLADGADGGLVVHCTAGKDRAGFAAALILSVLGVAREDIVQDYMLTNRFWDGGGRERPGMDEALISAIFSARTEYLDAAFAAIDGTYGSVEVYLRERIGLTDGTRAIIRGFYLE